MAQFTKISIACNIIFFVRKCVFLVKRDFSPSIPLKLSFCVRFPNALYQDLD